MAVAAQIFLQQEDMPTEYPRGNPKINELVDVKKRGWITICETCNLNEVSFQLSLVKLAKSGLIRELVGYLDNAGQGIYVITPIFREFAKHIRTTSNQPIMGFDQSNAKD
jgi:hypothetical protein